MRTLTATQSAALASRTREVAFRVFVDSSGGGVYVDLTALEGYDWVRKVSWDENVDQPIATASVTLNRAVYNLNLAPYFGGSKLNNGAKLLDVGRRIYIETATVVMGAPISETDYVRMWQGFIDTIDPQVDTIEIQCRDEGAVLMDRYIEVERQYGSSGGATIVAVMQALLDDNLGAGIVTLATIGSPTFLILPYMQEKAPLMEAMRALTTQIGWDLRYKWNAASSSFKLTLWVPDRTNTTTAAYAFTADDIFTVAQMRLSRESVRNVVAVTYSEATTKLRQTVTVTNDSSITKYGRRYMEIAEASTSQIDTSAEASLMANAALSDLREPNAEHEVELPYFWPAELGDLYAFGGNNVLYDATQYFAVINIRHELGDGEFRTTMMTRGYPAAGYKRWLSIEGRPGVAPNNTTADPTGPQNVSVSQKPLGFTLAHDVPANPQSWSRTEVYGSPQPNNITQEVTNGKRNKPSGTLMSSARSTMHSVDNLLNALEQTKMYNVAAVLVDNSGNYSPMSTQIAVNVARIGAAMQNINSADYALLRNNDFNQFTRGTNSLPDFWLTGLYAPWKDPAALLVDDRCVWWTQGGSGAYAVQLYARGYHGLVSKCEIVSYPVPFAEGDVISVSCTYKCSLDLGADGCLRVDYYQKTSTGEIGDYINSNLAQGVVNTNGEWIIGLNEAWVAPNGTGYIRIAAVLAQSNNDRVLIIDRIGCARGKPHLNARMQYYPDQFETDTDAPLISYIELDGNVGFVYSSDHKAWQAQVGARYRFSLQAGLHSTNLFSGSDWADLWIAVSSDGGATWRNLGRTKTVTDDDGYAAISLSTPTVYLGRGHLVRPMIRPTETFEMDSDRIEDSSFIGECVSRGDTA